MVKDSVYSSGDRNVQFHKWESLESGDEGGIVPTHGFTDICVQVFGTFGGATVTIQGSNDKSTFATLHEPGGSNLSFTAAGIQNSLENPGFIRPVVTGGTGSDITVVMLAAHSNR